MGNNMKTYSATGLRKWLEKEQFNAYWRAKVKSVEGDVTGAQWWRGNGAMAKRVLAWIDAQSHTEKLRRAGAEDGNRRLGRPQPL